MRVPLKWLARYVELRTDAEQLAELLNGSGTEVARIDRTGSGWKDIKVAEILKVEKHPNADRLSLATVTTGAETLTVVCGAPNIAAGQKVPFAPVGVAILGHTLEARPIRGIRSEGMLCAADELELSADHSGILILDPAETPGRPLSDTLGDAVLELEVTPNRSDCLSMIGVAREIAALTRVRLRLPALVPEEGGAPIEADFSLEVQAPELCPRFVARLARGVSVAPSPWWIQTLLHAAGVRSINNVVDVTNFLMLEWGKPLHAYDFDYLRGHQIVVRRARDDEKLVTLDGAERELRDDMLAIADAEGSIGLAGIMGGAESEVKDSTRNVLLESANFDAINVRRTARRLGMHSEAVRRFERGVDPDITGLAADQACYWFGQLAGGVTAPGAIDRDKLDHTGRRIDFDPAETGRLLGKVYSPAEVRDVLERLEFKVANGGGERLLVSVPSWRLDVQGQADLVEEVARISGYEQMPVTMPDGPLPTEDAQDPAVSRRRILEDDLRDALKGAGLTETVTYTLLPEGAASKLVVNEEGLLETPTLLTSLLIEPIKLANAMTEEQECLRTSMLPSSLQVYAWNRRHTTAGLAFFEVGRVFWQRLGDLPEERNVLALLMAGPRETRSWHGADHVVDFFDAKGVVELVLGQAGLQARFEPAGHPSLHPGRAASISQAGQLLGYLGQIHPLVLERLDLPSDPVFVAEIDIDALSALRPGPPQYRGIGRYPAVARQLSIAVDPGVTAEDVLGIILRAGGELSRGVELVDVFELPSGQRSLSYAFNLQSDERTLTDEEANEVRDRIMAALREGISATQR
ncbi:MAG: phenylalanine--tRNA ligase subunit beta [Chloroflexota bacterium]